MNRFRHFRHPSAATVISLVALFFALSGTAVAATGGNFILGKSNTATSLSSLTNTKGTALSLSSSATAAPLKVSNTNLVPNLNASELDGVSLQGIMQGTGVVGRDRVVALGHGSSRNFLNAEFTYLTGNCDIGGTGAALQITYFNTGTAQVVWWNKDGTGSATLNGTQTTAISPTSVAPYVVVAQIDDGSSIVTDTVTATYNSSTDTCSFTGQSVLTNG